MSRERAKGTAWESAIVQYLRDVGWPHAERRALHGTNDQGDVAGVISVVIEAKNAARVQLAAWLDEAERERRNADADVGAVWFKRRGKASPGDGFVLLSGRQFARLLRQAGFGDQGPIR